MLDPVDIPLKCIVCMRQGPIFTDMAGPEPEYADICFCSLACWRIWLCDRNEIIKTPRFLQRLDGPNPNRQRKLDEAQEVNDNIRRMAGEYGREEAESHIPRGFRRAGDPLPRPQ